MTGRSRSRNKSAVLTVKSESIEIPEDPRISDLSRVPNNNFLIFFDPLNFAFMTRINHIDIVFLNFFLRFSARDIPVLKAKKQSKIQFLLPF